MTSYERLKSLMLLNDANSLLARTRQVARANKLQVDPVWEQSMMKAIQALEQEVMTIVIVDALPEQNP